MEDTPQDVQEIIDHFNEHPNDVEEWHLLGVAFLSLNLHNDAEETFKHCLKLDKNNAFALSDLGGLYILKGKPKDAIRNLANPMIHSEQQSKLTEKGFHRKHQLISLAG